jgi:hypothetical protein
MNAGPPYQLSGRDGTGRHPRNQVLIFKVQLFALIHVGAVFQLDDLTEARGGIVRSTNLVGRFKFGHCENFATSSIQRGRNGVPSLFRTKTPGSEQLAEIMIASTEIPAENRAYCALLAFDMWPRPLQDLHLPDAAKSRVPGASLELGAG